MPKPKKPAGLTTGGAALWDAITKEHPELDPVQAANLTEACRLKGRLDELDAVIQGKGVLELMRFRVLGDSAGRSEDEPIHIQVHFDAALTQANGAANQMKQQLAALRLPDGETGKRPQQRGGGRGAYKPGGSTGTVSSLERARQAKSS